MTAAENQFAQHIDELLDAAKGGAMQGWQPEKVIENDFFLFSHRDGAIRCSGLLHGNFEAVLRSIRDVSVAGQAADVVNCTCLAPKVEAGAEAPSSARARSGDIADGKPRVMPPLKLRCVVLRTLGPSLPFASSLTPRRLKPAGAFSALMGGDSLLLAFTLVEVLCPKPRLTHLLLEHSSNLTRTALADSLRGFLPATDETPGRRGGDGSSPRRRREPPPHGTLRLSRHAIPVQRWMRSDLRLLPRTRAHRRRTPESERVDRTALPLLLRRGRPAACGEGER